MGEKREEGKGESTKQGCTTSKVSRLPRGPPPYRSLKYKILKKKKKKYMKVMQTLRAEYLGDLKQICC